MRAFIIVIDGFGVGAMPDCKKYGDYGANTLKNVRSAYDLNLPYLADMGLYNIEGTYNDDRMPNGAYGRMMELSKGKDTTVGHWEIAGVITKDFMPTFPNGFPKEFVTKLEKGRTFAYRLPDCLHIGRQRFADCRTHGQVHN